jgi:hypothetical protein
VLDAVRNRRDRIRRAARRHMRAARRAACWTAAAAGLWLLVWLTAGPGLAQRGRAERWARRAGLAARAAAGRPVPHRPKPARTPIHDEAAFRQQKGA